MVVEIIAHNCFCLMTLSLSHRIARHPPNHVPEVTPAEPARPRPEGYSEEPVVLRKLPSGIAVSGASDIVWGSR